MDRGSKIVLGGLAAVIALAFVTLGPGRTLYEPAAAQDMSSTDDFDAQNADEPGYEPDPVITTVELNGNRSGYSDPDPLADDGIVATPAPRIDRSTPPQSRAADRRSARTERSGERAAQAASGLDDGDISTTGDLAF